MGENTSVFSGTAHPLVEAWEYVAWLVVSKRRGNPGHWTRILKREVPRVKPERRWVLKLLKLLEEYGFVSKRRGVYECGKKTLYYLNYRKWVKWLYCERRACPCGEVECPYCFVLRYVGAVPLIRGGRK